jgi:four helix bundle protein
MAAEACGCDPQGVDYRQSILWTKAIRLAGEMVVLSRRLPPEERFGMRSQLTRAATSIPSNVAEGWVRETWREKINFLAIAHGSLAELDEMITALKRRLRDKPGRAPQPTTKMGPEVPTRR